MVRIKNRVVIKAALLALLVFAASGCNDNLLRPKAEKAKAEVTKTESKLYRVEGYFEQKGAVPAAFNSTAEGQNARTAMPDMTGIEYSIKAENGTTTYSSDNSGNIEIDGTFFKLALPQGTWTITVEGRTAAAGSTDAACVTGNAKVTLSAENPVAQVNIAVKPSMNGTGSVALDVGVAPDSGINGVKWTLPDPVRSSGFIDFSTAKTGNITIDQIQSGSYTLVMEFYSGSSRDDEGQLLYMVRESVNVFDGATTDTWTGSSPYLIGTTFTVTKELVETFAQTTFYVSLGGDDSNSGSLPSLPFATIQKAVDKAVAMNDVLPSEEDTPYRILLLSDVTYDGTASFAGNNNAFVNITPTESLHLVIEPYKKDVATIDANRNESNSGRVMYIGEKAKVTMNSLTITGGHITADGDNSGGGIYSKGNCIFSSCIVSGNTATYGGGLNFSPASTDTGGNKLELTDCKIEDNTAEGDGGGIWFSPENGGNEGIPTTLKLTDCTISGNTATRDNGSVYGGGIYCSGKAPKVILDGGSIKNNTVGSENNMVYAYGGGIYSEGGTVTISGATISENKAISNNNQAYGGGVYNAGSFTMDGGIIGKEITEDDTNKQSWEYAATETSHSNYASGGGGGIYASGKVTITNGKISYNYAPNADAFSEGPCFQGGGIYANSGCTLSLDGTEVSYNSAYQGAGIFCCGAGDTDSYNTSDVCTIKNATIKGNYARTVGHSDVGGGVFSKNYQFSMEGSTVTQNFSGDGGAGLFLEKTIDDEGITISIGSSKINDNKYHDSGYKWGSEILLFDKASLDISSDDVVITSLDGETKGIYLSGLTSLNLSGSACIDSPVYLENGRTITITGDLTTEGTVATITPGNYEADVQVLQVDSGVSGVDLADQVGKFNVTPQAQSDGTTTAWYISPGGNLTTKFPASRLSEENYNDITEIMVGSAGDMNKISELAQSKKTFEDKTITLQGNVTLDENYVPIEKFSGRFDGNNKTITLPEGNPITALFTNVEGKNDSTLAEVKRLTVNGKATKAGIAAEATYAKISECTSNVDVTHDSGMFEEVGGIVGILRANCIVEYCINKGSISSSAYSAYVGGIVGYVDTSQILNCINTGSVSGTGASSFVGGIVGSAYNCYVVNCGNEDPVTGSNEDTSVGGIAGKTRVSNGSEGIYNCYNIASVSGGMYTGGIVGDFGEYVSFGAYVCNTYNSGYVSSTVTNAYIGGVIGRNNAGDKAHKENNFYYRFSNNPYTGVGKETADDDTKTTAMTSTASSQTDKSSELNNWRNDNKLTDINGYEIDYKTWTYDSANAYCKFVEED